MKLLHGILLLFVTPVLMAQSFSVMTYNIRYATPKDGENAWSQRKEKLANQVNFFSPDFLGIQEGLEHQVNYLKEHLDGYTYVGVGRDDGKKAGEFSALYFKENKFSKLKSGTFWLSETPDKPSKAWDAALNRICTYALLKDNQSGIEVWVFNTHFDHRGVAARENSAKLITRKVKELADVSKDNIIIMGDLNASPDDAPIKIFKDQFFDSRSCENCVVFGPEGTFNNFNIDHPLDRRIDYIFINDRKLKVDKYGVLSELIDHKFTSDHFPVYVEVSVK